MQIDSRVCNRLLRSQIGQPALCTYWLLLLFQSFREQVKYWMKFFKRYFFRNMPDPSSCRKCNNAIWTILTPTPKFNIYAQRIGISYPVPPKATVSFEGIHRHFGLFAVDSHTGMQYTRDYVDCFTYDKVSSLVYV